MSRITKYFKQTCAFVPATRSSTNAITTNKYGEITYATPKTVCCRHEVCIKDIETKDGELIKSSDRYFLDNSNTIQVGDTLDGRPIIVASSLVNESGETEGYECYV